MKESFVKSDVGNIHTLYQEGSVNKPLLLMIPGMLGVAEHWGDEFKRLNEYPLLAMSVRGRGKSSFDFQSYSFEDQVSDILAVINSRQEKNLILVAHSFGCLLAVAAATKMKERIIGLILIDKGLSMGKLTDNWLERVRNNPPSTSTFEIAQKIFLDSKAIDLSEDFNSLYIPTLFFKGESVGHVLSEEEAQKLSKLPTTKIIRLKNSGHSPEGEDYEIFISEVHSFVESL